MKNKNLSIINTTLNNLAFIFLYLLIFASILSLIFQVFIGYKTYANSNRNLGIKKATTQLGVLDLIPIATNVLGSPTVDLKGQSQGRTNFLLLGEDPENKLLDTIIIVSYFYKEKKITSINIPRDFYVSTPDISGEKINGIVAVIDKYKQKTGLEYFIKLLESELQIDINYYAKINVNGLRKVVDLIDGVEIDIKCSFTDYEFPTDGYTGYIKPAPSFKKGIEKMNGTRASIYARSRKSLDCNEGSDFARSRRQSEVISAVVKKIKDKNIFENSLKINDYLNVINSNLETNLTSTELYSFYKQLENTDLNSNYLSYNLSTESPFLCETRSKGGQYIITYGKGRDCGSFIAGSKGTNVYKNMFRKLMQNILNEAKPS